VARIGFSDSPTASGIVAAWRAMPELLGGTVFPVTKSALILLSGFYVHSILANAAPEAACPTRTEQSSTDSSR
jgi:hypothetical protein